jgi:hypothetical protein
VGCRVSVYWRLDKLFYRVGHPAALVWWCHDGVCQDVSWLCCALGRLVSFVPCHSPPV